MAATDDKKNSSDGNEARPMSSTYERHDEKDAHLAAEEGYAATDR